MDDTPTTTREGPGEPERGEPRPDRVPSCLLLRIALAIIGTAVLAGIAWLARYQPVVAGNAATIPGDLAEEFFQGREEVVVDYEHGETYTYGFTVQNTGPLPTTVRSVVIPGAGLLHPESIRLAPAEDPLELDAEDAVPFEPFRLEVGEERGIVITSRFLRCDRYEGGGGIRKVGEEISVRTFLLTRTASVRFPQTIRVRTSGDGTGIRPKCPVVGPDLEVPTERPSDGPLDLEGVMLATPEAEIWLTSMDRQPWSDCRGTIESDDGTYTADVGRIEALGTRRVTAADFRLDGRPFRSRRDGADRLGLSCMVAGEERAGQVALRPYEPRDLDALHLEGFEYRQE